MAHLNFSTKRLQISKANTQVVMVVSIAAFVTTFSLVMGHSLLGTRSYQARLIAEKEKAVEQLVSNKEAVSELAESYNNFVSSPVNIIDGSSTGNGDRDGDNSKIVLDALPSKYDFPALTSSLEKLFGTSYNLSAISGTDDEVAQKETKGNPNPEPIEIPVQFGASGGYNSMQNLLVTLERSIRPFDVMTLGFSAGADGNITANISMKTYYQPEKALSITKKELK